MNRQQAKLKQELNHLRRQKSVLWLGILFFVAVLVWTSFAIFGSQKKVKIDSRLIELAKPLIPRLGSEVFPQIEQQRYLSEEDLSSFPIYVYWLSEEGGVGQLTDIMQLPVDLVTSEASSTASSAASSAATLN